MQDHFGPHHRQRARGLGDPHVVADAHTELAHIGHVEEAEFVAAGHAHLVRVEGEHLAVPRHHAAFRIDDRGGVVDLFAAFFEDAAGQQPDAVFGGDRAHLLLEFPRHWLGIGRERTVRAKLAEHHHVHPRVQVHEDVELQLHGLHVGHRSAHPHLDASYREWFHG